MVFASKLIMEQEDAKTFGENEEVCASSHSAVPKAYSSQRNYLILIDHRHGLGKCLRYFQDYHPFRRRFFSHYHTSPRRRLQEDYQEGHLARCAH